MGKGIGVGPAKDPLMLKLAYSLFGKTIICIAVCLCPFTYFSWLYIALGWVNTQQTIMLQLDNQCLMMEI